MVCHQIAYLNPWRMVAWKMSVSFGGPAIFRDASDAGFRLPRVRFQLLFLFAVEDTRAS